MRSIIQIYKLQLLAAVGLSSIAALVSAGRIFLDAGGWGLALAVWFLATANMGWQALKMGIGEYGCRTNAEIAMAMVVGTHFLVGLILSFNIPKYSSLWALLLPILFLFVSFALVMVYEWMVRMIDPFGNESDSPS